MTAIKTSFYKRPLFVLMSTLLIGILMGAAITGTIASNRINSIRSFVQADGFTTLMTDIISPVSDAQNKQISPIIMSAGQDIETLVDGHRAAISKRFILMKIDLAPHLTEQQMKALQEREMIVRKRLQTKPS